MNLHPDTARRALRCVDELLLAHKGERPACYDEREELHMARHRLQRHLRGTR